MMLSHLLLHEQGSEGGAGQRTDAACSTSFPVAGIISKMRMQQMLWCKR
jgi:hypothetical protein